ncbi:MAG: hypothetical protein ISS83_00850 [Candidatus Pacebacteria bacterium]|nr:hypothetical protein [Candidatus Paceibacterota bacterium]
MHSESIDKKTRYILEKIGDSSFAKDFYLAGGTAEYNKLHILKSFSYFDDAESDPAPMMIQDIEWGKIKEVIADKAKKLLDDEGVS